MGMETARAIDAATMSEAFRRTVQAHADRTAVRTKDDEVSLTWAQLRDRVDGLAGGLHDELGVRRGDTVALLLTNRPEFYVADLAVMTLGATPFSLYATLSPEQVQFVVADANARVAVCEAAFLPVLRAARELGGTALETIVVLEGADGDDTRAWTDVEAAGAGFDSEPHWRAQEPDDLLTLIYTSGTTGPPKGVQLTHRNLMAATAGVEDRISFPDGSRVISWLPSAHIAERTAHLYIPVTFGLTVTTCPDPKQIVAYLAAVHPTWFFAVPRIWEKLRGALLSGVFPEGSEPRAALDAAIRRVELRQTGESVPADVAAAADAGEPVFAQVRANVGLDEAITINAGAAPTPRDVLVFFHAIGLPLAELWGMSETCGAGTVNPPDDVRIGTVGTPTRDVEIALAEDGELLVRAPVVMGGGYRNQAEKTAETIDADGWLHTGDIGRIDEDGYLTIVDRKKEIIINAGGKNMSPANIEATVKSASPLIGNACVIGDARPFNVALIVLDADIAPAWAAQNDIQDTSLAALAVHPVVRAALQAAVEAANAKLSRVEQIKRFHVVSGDWAPGGDEITPTMKLKRRPIDAKYVQEIEALYAP